MPIRFKGPVRPKKLKSPDPIKMPVVRNDKVPKIKSDVLYYKENGSLPEVDPPWRSLEVYMNLPSSGSSARGADCVVVDGDIMALHVGDNVSSVYFYKRTGTTWQQTDTLSLSDISSGRTVFDRENNCVYVGQPNISNFSGQTMRYDFDFATGTVTNAGDVCVDIATPYGLEGRQLVMYKDLLVVSAPTWRQSTDYGGLIGYRSRTDTLNSRKTVSHNLSDSSVHTQAYLTGLQFPPYDDLMFGGSMDVDGDRLLVAAIGRPQENSGAHSFISVFKYDESESEMTEVQRIANPFPMPTNDYRIIAVRAKEGSMVAVCTGNKEQSNTETFSIIEYTWNGTEYVRGGWYNLPDEIYLGVSYNPRRMYNITMLSATEILIPYQDGTGRIMKVTK